MCLYLGSEVGEAEIIWGLKFCGPKCAYLVQKFKAGDIIRGLIFLCPQKLIFRQKISDEQLIISGLRKSWSDYLEV